MTDSPDYRKYIEKCFGTIDEKLDMVIDQMTKANHRVSKLEDKANERQSVIDDFHHLEKDYGCTKAELLTIKADLEEYRLLKKHPTLGIILIVVFVVGVGLSALQTVKSLGWKGQNTEMNDRLKAIEYTLIDKLGVSPVTRGAKAQDTVKDKIKK